MQYIVLGYDDTDKEALARRMKVRQAHIALGDEMHKQGKHLFGVALLNENKDMIGSMLVVDFQSRKALEDWLAMEPYVTGKVWKKIVIIPCKVGPSFESSI